MKAAVEQKLKGQVYCLICTHTVPADVKVTGNRIKVTQGQRCPRCAATLDVAQVIQLLEAA